MSRALLLCIPLALGGVACNKSAPVPPPPPASGPSETAVPVLPTYSLETLARDLKSSNAQNRDKAIAMVAELDAADVEVTPTLLSALRDSTCHTKSGETHDKPTSTRETAVLALLKLGTKGKKLLADQGLKVLVDGLKDTKPVVREHTVNALGMMGPDAKSAVEAVAALCADKDKYVRSAAYRALQKIKSPPGVTIAKLLTNPDVGIATDAAAALSWVKPNTADAVPVLLDALKLEPSEKLPVNDVTYIRNAAADALAASGKHSEAAIPALVELLQKTTAAEIEQLFRPARIGEKRSYTSGAVSALRRIGKPALPMVLPLLKNEEPIVRYQAAIIVGGMGPDEMAQEAVMTALQEERGLPKAQLLVFEELVLAALDLGAPPEKITERVLTLLSDDAIEVRYRGALMIARVGRPAATAVGKLTEMLAELEPAVVRAALLALKAIGPAAKSALPELIKKIDGDDNNMARLAIKIVREFGTDAQPAVPALIKALKANDYTQVVEVVDALGIIGASATEAVPALTKLLEAENSRPEERHEVIQAFARMGPAAKTTLPVLLKETASKDVKSRELATLALGKVGVGHAEAVKRLAEMLKDSQGLVRLAALKALALHGNAAKIATADITVLAEKGPGAELKLWASATLVVLGVDSDAHLKAIGDALKERKSESQVTRGAAIDAASLLGPKAKGFVPELTAALKEKPIGKERNPLRDRAVRSLTTLGDMAKDSIPALVDLLRENDVNLRRSVAQALGAMGPAAVLAVPKLRDLARSEPEAADVANMALDRIVPAKKMDE